MKRFLSLVVLLLSCARAEPLSPDAFGSTTPITVCFSTSQDCESQIVALVDGAKKTLRVTAYSFTSVSIADAIVQAKTRGVDVGVILDDSNRTAKGSKLAALVAAGVPTWLDAQHAIQHEKTMVADGITVEAGSYNYSAAAQKANAEDLLIVRSRAVATQYVEEWERHRGHSEVAK